MPTCPESLLRRQDRRAVDSRLDGGRRGMTTPAERNHIRFSHEIGTLPALIYAAAATRLVRMKFTDITSGMSANPPAIAVIPA